MKFEITKKLNIKTNCFYKKLWRILIVVFIIFLSLYIFDYLNFVFIQSKIFNLKALDYNKGTSPNQSGNLSTLFPLLQKDYFKHPHSASLNCKNIFYFRESSKEVTIFNLNSTNNNSIFVNNDRLIIEKYLPSVENQIAIFDQLFTSSEIGLVDLGLLNMGMNALEAVKFGKPVVAVSKDLCALTNLKEKLDQIFLMQLKNQTSTSTIVALFHNTFSDKSCIKNLFSNKNCENFKGICVNLF